MKPRWHPERWPNWLFFLVIFVLFVLLWTTQWYLYTHI